MTSGENWTPGPWEVRTSGYLSVWAPPAVSLPYSAAMRVAGDVCHVRRWAQPEQFAAQLVEERANAQLISAAPELYEALDEALAIIGDNLPAYTVWLNRATAALAKARGEVQP